MAENNEFQLDAELQRRIETFAQGEGCTPAQVVREAFEQFEAQRHNGGHRKALDQADAETVYDVWTRAGLIGCIDDPDLPTDLSTNPKHMEGFGGC